MLKRRIDSFKQQTKIKNKNNKEMSNEWHSTHAYQNKKKKEIG